MNEDNLSSGTKHALAHSFYPHPAQARDAARRATWLQKKQDSQQKPPAAVTIGDDDNVPLETLESSVWDKVSETTKSLIYQSGLRNLFMKNLLHCPKETQQKYSSHCNKRCGGHHTCIDHMKWYEKVKYGLIL